LDDRHVGNGRLKASRTPDHRKGRSKAPRAQRDAASTPHPGSHRDGQKLPHHGARVKRPSTAGVVGPGGFGHRGECESTTKGKGMDPQLRLALCALVTGLRRAGAFNDDGAQEIVNAIAEAMAAQRDRHDCNYLGRFCEAVARTLEVDSPVHHDLSKDRYEIEAWPCTPS
jgi:hypothetical protein